MPGHLYLLAVFFTLSEKNVSLGSTIYMKCLFMCWYAKRGGGWNLLWFFSFLKFIFPVLGENTLLQCFSKCVLRPTRSYGTISDWLRSTLFSHYRAQNTGKDRIPMGERHDVWTGIAGKLVCWEGGRAVVGDGSLYSLLTLKLEFLNFWSIQNNGMSMLSNGTLGVQVYKDS